MHELCNRIYYRVYTDLCFIGTEEGERMTCVDHLGLKVAELENRINALEDNDNQLITPETSAWFQITELQNRIKALENTTHDDLYDRVESLERKLFAHI